MKNTLLILFLCFNLSSICAQEVVSMFLEKHGKDESIEYRSIGKKMFAEMKEQHLADSLLLPIISELDNISVIYSKDQSLSTDYFNSALAILNKQKEFDSIYAGEQGDNTTVLVRGKKGITKELVIISSDADGFNLISIRGNIPLEAFLDYSEDIGINTFKDLIQ